MYSLRCFLISLRFLLEDGSPLVFPSSNLTFTLYAVELTTIKFQIFLGSFQDLWNTFLCIHSLGAICSRVSPLCSLFSASSCTIVKLNVLIPFTANPDLVHSSSCQQLTWC
ncbi:hypothetical protein ILYODFUR_036843 [Ilyodon furcidens]|uniref:Uncharacterized protein n=1 Tax=Ilyodon furcidens TaxID=33524 RepID=A0ABV0THQ8_9TELE